LRIDKLTQWVCWSTVLVGVLLPCPGSNACHAEDSSGTIEGTVIYRPDASRRWRYARYYVKNSKQGQLAEAVVALKSSRLKRLKLPAKKRSPAVVDQKNFRFIPETIAIRAGTNVKFQNSDPQVHNVRSAAGLHPFNINMPPGTDHQESFDLAGGTRQPIVLGCSYHSSMRGWVFVFSHPFFHVTDATGKYRFENVPAGSYTIEMRHPAGELRLTRKLVVKAGETVKLDILVSPDDKVSRN